MDSVRPGPGPTGQGRTIARRPAAGRPVEPDRSNREEFFMNRSGGLGIVGVIIVVLVILWLVGVIKL
jgi:hypothetical protein